MSMLSSALVATPFRNACRVLVTAAVSLTCAGARSALAQTASDLHPMMMRQTYAVEFRPIADAFVPSGDLRDRLKRAVLIGVQASYAFVPHFAGKH
jgi:hypothetical protein